MPAIPAAKLQELMSLLPKPVGERATSLTTVHGQALLSKQFPAVCGDAVTAFPRACVCVRVRLCEFLRRPLVEEHRAARGQWSATAD